MAYIRFCRDQDPLWMDKVDYYVSQLSQLSLHERMSTYPFLLPLTVTQHHGFSKISYNSTTLEFQFIRHQKGEVFDRFVLKKGASGEGSGSLGEETTEEIAIESPLGL